MLKQVGTFQGNMMICEWIAEKVERFHVGYQDLNVKRYNFWGFQAVIRGQRGERQYAMFRAERNNVCIIKL